MRHYFITESKDKTLNNKHKILQLGVIEATRYYEVIDTIDLTRETVIGQAIIKVASSDIEKFINLRRYVNHTFQIINTVEMMDIINEGFVSISEDCLMVSTSTDFVCLKPFNNTYTGGMLLSNTGCNNFVLSNYNIGFVSPFFEVMDLDIEDSNLDIKLRGCSIEIVIDYESGYISFKGASILTLSEFFNKFVEEIKEFGGRQISSSHEYSRISSELAKLSLFPKDVETIIIKNYDSISEDIVRNLADAWLNTPSLDVTIVNENVDSLINICNYYGCKDLISFLSKKLFLNKE